MCFRKGITLGSSGFWFWQEAFVAQQERRAHMYILGTTTKGKSKLMEHCLYQDIVAGRGAGLIDPHGDLADDLLRYLASKRDFFGFSKPFTANPHNLDRLIYIDPARSDYCVGINPLQVEPGADLYEAATDVIEAFRRIWPVSLAEAPVFSDLMLNTLIALMENGLTLLEIPRVLTEREYREELLRGVRNPSVVDFFHSRYDRWGREQALRIESTLNKVSALVTSERLRNILGQRQSTLDFREVLDSGKVLVVNLGDCGAAVAGFLGSIILSRLQQAAVSRRDISKREERRPYYLYIDEFQSFVGHEGGGKTLSQLLSTAAKFGLQLVAAHQSQSQLDHETKGALGNVGVKVVFGVDREDAEAMARRLFSPDLTQIKSEPNYPTQHPLFTPLAEQWEQLVQELQNLPPRCAYARSGTGQAVRLRAALVHDGDCSQGDLERVKLHSLRRYARPRGEVAAEIAKRVRGPERRGLATRLEPLR